MAIYKCTALFSQTTNQEGGSNITRTGGWSESWYLSYTSTSSLIEGFRKFFCEPRARLLNGAAAIIGQRFQQVDPKGGSILSGHVYPGNIRWRGDVPQMSMLCTIPASGATNIRRFTLRGFPDVYVVNGEFVGDADINGLMADFANNMTGFLMRGRDFNQPKKPIFNILTDGNVFPNEPFTVAVNDIVSISKAMDANGILRGGQYRVVEVTDPQDFKVTGWQYGMCFGGTVSRIVYTYPAVDGKQLAFNRITLRRVGRPSNQFRGRRSKRRRTVPQLPPAVTP